MTVKKIKGSVIVLCLNDPASNARPKRAIELCLSEGYDVSVIGLYKKDIKGLKDFFALETPSMSLYGRLFRKLLGLLILLLPIPKLQSGLESLRFGFIKIQKIICQKNYDLIIVEDLQLLVLAFKIRGMGKIIFDAREYYPLQKDDIWFNLIEKPRRVQLCRSYLPSCDAVLTVSQGLQEEYLKEFGVLGEVYLSTPYYSNTPIKTTKPKMIRMVYHGLAHMDRGLDNLIDLFSMLDDRFNLDFVLVGNEMYQKKLKIKAKPYPRIGFVEPVSYENIIPHISFYDIGLLYYEPKTFNLKHSLPNKFFEYIQARLMVVIGPSPDMAELVRMYKCGVVADEFSISSLAKALNSLNTDSIDHFKRQSDLAAKELCFENESKKMIQLLDSLLA